MELPFNFYPALFALLTFSSCTEQWVLKFNTWKGGIKNGVKISKFYFYFLNLHLQGNALEIRKLKFEWKSYI